jgi:Amidohydrolase family
MDLDVIIENGTLFDGTGAPGTRKHVGLREGKVALISEGPLPRGPNTRVIDATGLWVTPGFIDLHTHYDAEIELAPALTESVRHGVTTVTLGSCSLSLAVGTPEDLADQFARVEAIPYDAVRSLLERAKTWNTHHDYIQHLGTLALGPNVASFVGHSAVRAHVLGMERSLDSNVRPTEDEYRRMEALVGEGLDEGCLGLSVQTLPWDKVGGSRDVRSRPLPSTFSTWAEYRRLLKQVRERGLVFQGVPNVSTKVNILLFLLESAGFFFRKALKTTVISMMDAPGQRFLRTLQSWLSRGVNVLAGGRRCPRSSTSGPTASTSWCSKSSVRVLPRSTSPMKRSGRGCSPSPSTARGFASSGRASGCPASSIATSRAPRFCARPTRRWSASRSRRWRPSAGKTSPRPSSTWWWSTATRCAGTR